MLRNLFFNLDFRNYQYWDTFPKFLGHWEIFGTKAVFCQNQHMGHQISLIFVMKFDYELTFIHIQHFEQSLTHQNDQ